MDLHFRSEGRDATANGPMPKRRDAFAHFLVDRRVGLSITTAERTQNGPDVGDDPPSLFPVAEW